MTDAADLDRLRRRQDTRTSRTRWARFRHRVRLHRPKYLSLVDTMGQPLVESKTDVRGRLAFGTLVAVLLVLILLPRLSLDAPPPASPPDLTSPGAVVTTPVYAPRHISTAQTHRVAPAAAIRPTSSPVITPAAAPGCPVGKVVPRAIRIPAITVSSRDVVPVGLNPDRTLAVPSLNKVGRLGWYSCSPVPGDTGPAVVVAHVDQKGHPGLFSKLVQLQPGDVVEIDRSDGQTATFRITQHEQFPKAEFDSSIYSDTPGPELRLITCTGELDTVHHSYLDQEVAFASLISLRPTVG